MKAIVVDKKCGASEKACKVLKICPMEAISYIEVEEAILDREVNCNSSSDCGCGCDDGGGDCGGSPYGRIIIDYDKCTGCGICVDECCGAAIIMVAESKTATPPKPAGGNADCCCPDGKC